ncbi:hypothetical protein AAFF_G00196400 [Aldrovandia affinis]|uniref:Uncharacterized protein n=1 Tax=Aldrovandia affinis TaxID=143900 RepID=A0AAD7W6T0_9TELE|nr:hypothetical protein AAFF_G00196400 [Aldrovandia affinis]
MYVLRVQSHNRGLSSPRPGVLAVQHGWTGGCSPGRRRREALGRRLSESPGDPGPVALWPLKASSDCGLGVQRRYLCENTDTRTPMPTSSPLPRALKSTTLNPL